MAPQKIGAGQQAGPWSDDIGNWLKEKLGCLSLQVLAHVSAVRALAGSQDFYAVPAAPLMRL